LTALPLFQVGLRGSEEAPSRRTVLVNRNSGPAKIQYKKHCKYDAAISQRAFVGFNYYGIALSGMGLVI